MAKQTESIQDRVAAVKALLESFRIERIVYIVVNIVSLLVLIVSASVLLVKGIRGTGTAQPTEVIGLFGSSGSITYSTGRLLRMWTDAIRFLQSNLGKED
jgi:hypothetical protein